MARSKVSSNKREKEKQRQKEKREKAEKMEERRANQAKGKTLDDMLAYVDEDGNITSTPPDPLKRKPVNAEDIDIGVPLPLPVDPAISVWGACSWLGESKSSSPLSSRTPIRRS